MRWPLREALLAYAAKLRHEARRWYEVQLLVWAPGAVWQKEPTPPELPEILKK